MKRDRLIKKIQTRSTKQTHKFSVAVMKTVKDAMEFDRHNGNHLWRNAVAKEIKMSCLLLNFKSTIRYQMDIDCHIIFVFKRSRSSQGPNRLDAQNTKVDAPANEKVYNIAWPGFGPENKGGPVLIIRALHGLRSSGARWRDHLSCTLRELGFLVFLQPLMITPAKLFDQDRTANPTASR